MAGIGNAPLPGNTRTRGEDFCRGSSCLDLSSTRSDQDAKTWLGHDMESDPGG